jgi:hypothetical protein
MSETVLAENYPLYLPSGLPDVLFSSTSADLLQKEIRVRQTVLETTFHELLRLLSVKMGIMNNKRSFVVGQKGNTRAQTLLASFSDKIDSTADRYRQVREALFRLDPNGKWITRLKPLLKTDVRMPQEDEDPDDLKQQRKAKKRKGLGEGARKPSWIWRVSDMQNEDGAGLGEGEVIIISSATLAEAKLTVMRVEWAKADARVTRWIEEKNLVMEEMRRTPWYLDWKAHWWEGLAHSWTEEMFCTSRPKSGVDFPMFRDGLTAYAKRQANVQRALVVKFTKLWTTVLDRHELTLTGQWPDLLTSK